MLTWAVIGVATLLVVIIGLGRTRRLLSRAGTDTLIGTLGKRYLGEAWGESFAPLANDQLVAADRLLAYSERVLDRQIGKARAILPFNAILLAVVTVEHSRVPDALHPLAGSFAFLRSFGFLARVPAALESLEIRTTPVLVVTLVGLALSSLMCLRVLTTKWGPIMRYGSFWHEASLTLRTVRARSRALEWATVIAQACLIAAVVLVAAAELNASSKREVPAVNARAPAPAPARVAAAPRPSGFVL